MKHQETRPSSEKKRGKNSGKWGKLGRGILGTLGLLLLVFAGIFLYKNYFVGLSSSRTTGTAERVEMSWEDAMKDGTISEEEIAVHYAPEILAAVNTVLSDSGRGDFLAPFDFDGDTACNNNWENMTKYSLNAVVYWSVQETQTHYLISYNFYHPRDDSEIWLDRHENDFEGIVIAAPKSEDGFRAPVVMYTQGHGGAPFFYDEDWTVTEKSRHDGGLELDGDRPVIYITPNGTLDKAGHSVESAKDHTTYLYVGNSGVRYYHGGVAEEPATYKGSYENNPCSYQLVSLKELWKYRMGPYGDGCVLASYGSFCGENYEKNAANTPWAWRNKTAFGLSGTFLSDPAWSIKRAIPEIESFSEVYVSNSWADWKLTLETTPGGFTAELKKNGTVVSTPEWFKVTEEGLSWVGEDREILWAAGDQDTKWEILVYDSEGNLLDAVWKAELQP